MPSESAHRRTHNLLLISKLLNLHDNASPLILVQDSLEQPAAPLLKEYIRRAKLSKLRTHIVYVAFQTLTPPAGVDVCVKTRGKPLHQVAKEVTLASASAGATTASARHSTPSAPSVPQKRSLVIIDSVHPLLSPRAQESINLTAYLGSLLGDPRTSPSTQTSLLMVYHRDVPILPSPKSAYAPSPLSLLTYLATSILTLHSIDHVLVEKAAKDRSMIAPVFGLAEEANGIILGLKDKDRRLQHDQGVVIQLEHRRRSGRGVEEWYFLPPFHAFDAAQAREVVILLDDHPLYRLTEEEGKLQGEDGSGAGEDEQPQSTFELGLTERQRRERANVVLPYFDAQKGDGPGEGGRILYEMVEEDDFDDEEDEI